MRDDRNIVITGFMGTGKTTVGQRVAELTGRLFVDTDERIVHHAGKPIADIFAQEGEAAFRLIERRMCRFYAGQRRLVVATGGGMLVDESNRKVMLASGFVFCLNATPEAIRQRLNGQGGRPLFSGDWEALLEKRRAAYAELPYQVDTTGKSPEEVAQEVVALWRSVSR